MKDKLPHEKNEVFDAIVRDLSTAIKNSSLYSPDHPVFDTSTKVLEKIIEEWFINEDKLVIGITPDNLLLDGAPVREENDLYAKTAQYLHQRGVMAVTIIPGVELKELVDFVIAIKGDDKALRAKGGILKVLPELPHIRVKAVDYSEFLSQSTGEVSAEEEDIWKSLCELKEGDGGGALPVSKQEFLTGFLDDTKKSAGTLNKIYRLAMAKLDDDATVDDIRATMTRITRYFEKKPGQESVAGRKTLSELIGKLDPSLVIKIFEEGGMEGEAGEFVKEMTKDFSDSMLSDFISSLIGGGGGFNENLLKLFDKMMPNNSDEENVVSMVTDNLLQKSLADKSVLEELRTSIKELVTVHPENSFMSEMYKITLGSFAGDQAEGVTLEGRLVLLMNELRRTLEEKNLFKEQVKLLLNLLWIEDDPSEFEKFIGKVAGYYEELIKSRDTGSIRRIVEFFTQKLPEKNAEGSHISGGIDKMAVLIKSGMTVTGLVPIIPDAVDTELDDIAYICSRLRSEHKFRLVDAFLAEKDPFTRDKFFYIFSKMGVNISNEIVKRMECENFAVSRDLFKVLKTVDPDKASAAMKEMLSAKDDRVKCEALEGFCLGEDCGREVDIIFKLFLRSKNEDLRQHALRILIGSRDKDIADKVFTAIWRKFRMHKYVGPFVKFCGDNKLEEALPYLEKVLFRKIFYNTKTTDELSVAVVVALGQIDTPEAKELIQRGLNLKREAVKNMCEIALKLGEYGEKPNKR